MTKFSKHALCFFFSFQIFGAESGFIRPLEKGENYVPDFMNQAQVIVVDQNLHKLPIEERANLFKDMIDKKNYLLPQIQKYYELFKNNEATEHLNNLIHSIQEYNTTVDQKNILANITGSFFPDENFITIGKDENDVFLQESDKTAFSISNILNDLLREKEKEEKLKQIKENEAKIINLSNEPEEVNFKIVDDLRMVKKYLENHDLHQNKMLFVQNKENGNIVNAALKYFDLYDKKLGLKEEFSSVEMKEFKMLQFQNRDAINAFYKNARVLEILEEMKKNVKN